MLRGPGEQRAGSGVVLFASLFAACGGNVHHSRPCVDTTSDEENCGACGVVCNGTCFDSHCIATLLTGVDYPGALAVDATSVYVIAKGEALKIPTSGGAPTTLAANVSTGGWIAVDASFVYWTTGLQLMKVPVSGGQTTVLEAGSANELSIDDAWAYVTAFGAQHGSITKVALAGGISQAIAEADTPSGVVVAGSSVYYGVLGQQSNGVMQVPVDGGPPTMLVAQPGSNKVRAADGTHVYWTMTPSTWDNPNDKPSLMKAPLAGGTPTVVAAEEQVISSLALDGGYAYYVIGDAYSFVKRVPLEGGSPVTIASASWARWIAVDATSVYWSSCRPAPEGGAVYKTPKNTGGK